MKKDGQKWKLFLAVDAVLLVLLAVLLLLTFFLKKPARRDPASENQADDHALTADAEELMTEEATEEMKKEEPLIPASFNPHAVAGTEPEKLIVSTDIIVNDEILEDQSLFKPWYRMNFGSPDRYTDVDGISTFRGDAFRSSAAVGTADLTSRTIRDLWSHPTGALTYQNATWTGSGWTGQPLMERWSRQAKAHMNMHDWAKEKDDLVEVIYACMDGYIYFLDLETGEETRDPMYLGYTFKGAGALDPRGYPILYVGSGYDSNEGISHAFIISLLDCSVMYTFGEMDPYSLRGMLSYFDSSALVDAASDTLIYPGENGILYLIHLNTEYDENAGTLTINPDDMVRWRYTGSRTTVESYWLGMEDSAAIYGSCLFVADNGGNLMCIDLNNLQLVWAADVLDDSNSTPVLSVEDGHLYLYISTSFHLGWRSYQTAAVPIWKIDAETGETVWQTDYECYSEEGVSGGVLSTIAAGKENLSDYIYVTVSRTGDAYSGVLACLEKATGRIVWEHKAVYAWSSPVCVYDENGSGVVLYCSCGGRMYMLDGITGREECSFELSEGALEASPAVYQDHAVIGTRAGKIWGLKIGR